MKHQLQLVSSKDGTKKDAKALSTIGLTVDDNQLVHIRNKETAKAAWNSLKVIHEKDTLTNRVSLYKKIALLRMNPDTKIEDHINEMDGYFQQLCDLGEEASELWKVGMLFASLPKEYTTLITALEARNESEITWSLVYSKLIDEYQRQSNHHEDKFEEKVLQVNGTKVFCHFCKKANHEMRDCYGFKRYQQFKDFEEYQHEKTERGKRNGREKETINEIKNEDDEEFILNIVEEKEEEHKLYSMDTSIVEKQNSNQIASKRTKSTIYIEILNLKINEVNMITDINDLWDLIEELNKKRETISDDFKLAMLLNKLPDHYRNYYKKIHIQEGLGWKGIKRKIFKQVKENAKISRKIKAEEKLFQIQVL